MRCVPLAAVLLVSAPTPSQAQNDFDTRRQFDQAIDAAARMCLVGDRYRFSFDLSGNLDIGKLSPGREDHFTVYRAEEEGSKLFDNEVVRRLVDSDVRGCMNTQWQAVLRAQWQAELPAAFSARHPILETGYSLLSKLGNEDPGYGLYSYVIATSPSDRSSAFLNEVLGSVPSVAATAASRAQINVLYIPLKMDQRESFSRAAEWDAKITGKLASDFASTFYDYKLARALLNHLCNQPVVEMKEFCAADSRGPFLFTYGQPASALEPVPAPFLFVDLSDVHPLAFAEFVSAFKTQAKQEDVTSGARLHTLRLKILSILLTAADWISPVQHAIADIVRSSE